MQFGGNVALGLDDELAVLGVETERRVGLAGIGVLAGEGFELGWLWARQTGAWPAGCGLRLRARQDTCTEQRSGETTGQQEPRLEVQMQDEARGKDLLNKH